MTDYTLKSFVADLDAITSAETDPAAITAKAAPLLARLCRNPEAIPVEYRTAPARFRARLRRGIVRSLEQVRRNIGTRREQVLDARSCGRFAGTEPEPRAGLRGGHIPGSLNLPYDALYQPDGTLLPAEGLREAFAASGLDPARPVATTCGSGITASVLALGLHLIGHKKVAVYDGSWTEWASHPDTPVEL